jgi:hypothetical protein
MLLSLQQPHPLPQQNPVIAGKVLPEERDSLRTSFIFTPWIWLQKYEKINNVIFILK